MDTTAIANGLSSLLWLLSEADSVTFSFPRQEFGSMSAEVGDMQRRLLERLCRHVGSADGRIMQLDKPELLAIIQDIGIRDEEAGRVFQEAISRLMAITMDVTRGEAVFHTALLCSAEIFGETGPVRVEVPPSFLSWAYWCGNDDADRSAKARLWLEGLNAGFLLPVPAELVERVRACLGITPSMGGPAKAEEIQGPDELICVYRLDKPPENIRKLLEPLNSGRSGDIVPNGMFRELYEAARCGAKTLGWNGEKTGEGVIGYHLVGDTGEVSEIVWVSVWTSGPDTIWAAAGSWVEEFEQYGPWVAIHARGRAEGGSNG